MAFGLEWRLERVECATSCGYNGLLVLNRKPTFAPMNNSVDAKMLGQAVESLASTIIEIIDSRLRHFAEGAKLPQPERTTDSEGWVDQKAAAEHLKISRRTLYDWMQKGVIPHVRLGRGVRFRLSDVDEAMKRRSRGGGVF
jgi:excisionase family DNA binding protein